MSYTIIDVPENGEKITNTNGVLNVPDNPIVPFIEGDGTGPDIWRAAVRVVDAAVEKAYGGKRKLYWMEVYAGQKAYDKWGEWMPDETVQAFNEFLVGIKGPLTTPAGADTQALNEALAGQLDLYACVRPVKYFSGIPSPVHHPDYVDMVIFRENTEDIYTGIEFENGTSENKTFKALLQEQFPKEFAKMRFPDTSGIGLKPVSREGTSRIVRAAVNYALRYNRKSVTLVHKGNIMKFTEGAFRNWGYELVEREFGDKVYTWAQWNRTKDAQDEAAANAEQSAALKAGKLLIKDVIADIVFQQTITRAREFDILATMNMNGDYLSDALFAQVGGLGFAPEGRINYESGAAIFEATHGTDPKNAERNVANPGAVVLSGAMMLRYMGWDEAADLIVSGMEQAISAKRVTADLYNVMDGADRLSTSEFGDEIIKQM